MSEIDPRARLDEATRLRGLADETERDAVRLALRLVGGNVRQAADLLGVTYQTFDKRLREGKFSSLLGETARRQGWPKGMQREIARGACGKCTRLIRVEGPDRILRKHNRPDKKPCSGSGHPAK